MIDESLQTPQCSVNRKPAFCPRCVTVHCITMLLPWAMVHCRTGHKLHCIPGLHSYHEQQENAVGTFAFPTQKLHCIPGWLQCHVRQENAVGTFAFPTQAAMGKKAQTR